MGIDVEHFLDVAEEEQQRAVRMESDQLEIERPQEQELRFENFGSGDGSRRSVLLDGFYKFVCLEVMLLDLACQINGRKPAKEEKGRGMAIICFYYYYYCFILLILFLSQISQVFANIIGISLYSIKEW